VGLSVGVLPTVQGYRAKREATISTFTDSARELCRDYAAQLAQLDGDLGSIHSRPILERLSKEDDVLSVLVLDPMGGIITDGTQRKFAAGERPNHDQTTFEASRVGQVVTRIDAGLLHVASPITSDKDRHGSLYMVLALSRPNAVAEKQLIIATGDLLSLMIAGVLVIWVLTTRLTAPLQNMSATLEKVAAGDYKVHVPVRSDDELGRLAGAINSIAATTKSSTVARRYLDEVLQSMADALFVVDTEANIVTVNRATLDLLGYTERQLVDQPVSRICSDEGYELTGSRLQRLLGTETKQDYELSYRSKRGDQIPISFSGSPIHNERGEVVGYVCIGKDISERKRAEQEREELHDALLQTSRKAGMAEVATGVLHNVGNVLNSVNMSASVVSDTVRQSRLSGLQKAVQMLTEQGEDMSKFFEDRGHQFTQYLEHLATQLADEQDQVLTELTSLTSNIDHIKDIIGMQQSYSKVSGVTEPVDLEALIDEALRLSSGSLEKQDVRVTRKIRPMPKIMTDKLKVLQIVVNLISNATDAMRDSAKPSILTVELRSDDSCEEQGTAQIVIGDTGIGIESANLARIFTHGFTTKVDGHGFGLHSAANGAMELGGSLSADSDGPSKGARFTLTIPMVMAEVRV